MNIPNSYDAMLPLGGWSHLIQEWTKHYPHHAEALRPYTTLENADVWGHLMKGSPFLLPDKMPADTLIHPHHIIIQNRRSIRTYQPKSLPITDLAYVLQMIYRNPDKGVSGQYHSIFQPKGGLELCKIAVLVNDVADMPSGAYLYDEHQHGLYPLRTDHPLTFLETICTQREFLRAPALFVMSGSLTQALAHYGERGYRYLLMEMGTVLSQLYFIVGSLGLGGSIAGSFIFRDLERWLGYDGIHQTIAATFAFGRPMIPDISE